MTIWKLMRATACIAGTAVAAWAQRPGGTQAPATVAAPRADTVRMTRRQAIRAALLTNPGLEVARQQTAQVRAQRIEGLGVPDPVVSYSHDDAPGLTRLGAADSRNLNVGLDVPFPDKFRLRQAIGAANVRSSEAQFLLAQQTLAADAGRAYDAVLVTRLRRRDLTESRDLAQQFLDRTQARFNAGTVPRLDVIRAQTDLAQAVNDLIANARDVANAEASMNRLLGRPLGAPFEAADSLTVPAMLGDLASYEQRAQTSRPELVDLAAQQRAARANSSLVREQAFLPDIAISANKDYASDAGTLYSAGLSLPIPLFFWNHTRGEFAETRHRELELAAAVRDMQAAVGEDVRNAWATADAAIRQAAFLRDQLLPSAQEAYRVATVSYSLGGLSALDVLDARRTLLDAQAQYAEAVAAANSARSDLERAAGTPLASLSGSNP
ncbi:MAG TPA: TolC family protein [Gemmatimonadaceae bacterium]|nr:TolC family protein [Gemmatimonadaceae bacterium]